MLSGFVHRYQLSSNLSMKNTTFFRLQNMFRQKLSTTDAVRRLCKYGKSKEKSFRNRSIVGKVQHLFWYSFMRWSLQLMQIQNEHFLIFTGFWIFSFRLVHKFYTCFFLTGSLTFLSLLMQHRWLHLHSDVFGCLRKSLDFSLQMKLRQLI